MKLLTLKSININGEDYFRKDELVDFFNTMYEGGYAQYVAYGDGRKAAISGYCLFMKELLENL